MAKRIEIKPISNTDNLTTFFSQDKVMKYCLSDGEIQQLKNNQWSPEDNSSYIKLEDENRFLGIVKYEPLSNVTALYHLYVSPDFWGKDLVKDIQSDIEQWFVSNTSYHKLVIMTPRCCENVISRAYAEGFKVEGVLIGAICWRNQIENLVLLGKFIVQNK